MNPAIVVAVFPIIFLGELPDKTMFASLVLSTKGRPLAVWVGAAVAFTLHVLIAVTIGVALFKVLSHRTVDLVVGALFLVGAVLAIREARNEAGHEAEEVALVEHESAGHRRTAITAFVVIFLAEWGDLTQILTANLAARYHSPASVALGAVLALWTVAALAVVGGQSLLRFVNVTTLRVVTAVILIGLAAYTFGSALVG
jgi:Ca2+/H+ antiporter, TMEM165/GDT1 family